jgi:hypothetical protein
MLNISELMHYADFNFNTSALGVLRCGPTGDDAMREFDKIARAPEADGEKLARDIILKAARKVTGSEEVDKVCGGPALSAEEVKEIARSELDDFSNQFIARRLSDTKNQIPGIQDDSTKLGCEKLPAAIVAYIDWEHAQMKQMLDDARASILGGLGLVAARTAADDGKSGLGQSLLGQIRKIGIGESTADRLRKDVLGNSAIGSALKTMQASDKLGESLRALRASTVVGLNQPERIVPPTIQIPPNPFAETNMLLKEQKAFAEEIRPTIIQCAELIQKLTDTTLAMQAFANNNAAQAEKHARRSMGVAIASIVIATVTSLVSIHYAKISPTGVQIENLTKVVSSGIDAATASAKEDRAAAELRAKQDRSTLVEALTKPVIPVAKPKELGTRTHIRAYGVSH